MNDSDMDLGEVVEIKGEFASVELQTKDACHSCGARFVCRPNDSGKRILYIRNILNAKVGDKVLIEQLGSNQLKLAIMQYGLPLLGFLISILVASQFISSYILGIPKDIILFLIGVVAIIIFGYITNIWCKRQALKNFQVFEMKEIKS
ncbi:MAG: hypothetical protein DRP89_09025 [Candidatus Neomarinimicrobiota bacterium]|nr:MAG: hypothetical protein DRP89_09025 [Candidatus Neomarinimicrobiota bacterium]